MQNVKNAKKVLTFLLFSSIISIVNKTKHLQREVIIMLNTIIEMLSILYAFGDVTYKSYENNAFIDIYFNDVYVDGTERAYNRHDLVEKLYNYIVENEDKTNTEFSLETFAHYYLIDSCKITLNWKSFNRE